MGSRIPPQQPWPPYPALKDCSQGYCSYYCPQWCYFLFPSPPPPTPPSSHTLSPFLIAVISIVSTAFLLTAYYLILSKFRRHFHSPPTTSTGPGPTAPPPPSSHGLDDTLISKLSSCQYRPGVAPDGADCSVCLGPFQERDLLRLLPRCDHAFHARCIDVWLRANSTCPLCRAAIVLPPISPPAPTTTTSLNQTVEDTPAAVDEPSTTDDDTIEIGEVRAGRLGGAGRSLSMDSPFRRQEGNGAAADVNDIASSSSSSSSRWTRALHCVVSPVRMKRSSSSPSSSGYTRRGRSSMLPI